MNVCINSHSFFYHPIQSKNAGNGSLKIGSSNDEKNGLNMNPKNHSMLKNLMEQKENLIDQKNKILSDMLKDGSNNVNKKDEIKEIEKKIQELDQTMREMELSNEQKKMGLDKEDQKTEEKKDPSMNKDLSQDEKPLDLETMKNLMGAQMHLKHLSSTHHMETTLKNESKILKKEIEIDEGRSLTGKAGKYKYDRYNQLKDAMDHLLERGSEAPGYEGFSMCL